MTNGIAGAQRRISNFTSSGSTIEHGSVLLQGRPLLARYQEELGLEPYIVRNVAPAAVVDTASVAAGSNVIINVRANDADADTAGADLTVGIVMPPANGAAVVENGNVRYTPNAGFSGSDSFTYRLTDELGVISNVVTAAVTVAPASGGGAGGGAGGGGGGGSFDLVLLALLAGTLLARLTAVDRR